MSQRLLGLLSHWRHDAVVLQIRVYARHVRSVNGYISFVSLVPRQWIGPRYFPDFIRPSQGVGARGLWALGLEGSEGV